MIKRALRLALSYTKIGRIVAETRGTQTPVTWRRYMLQEFVGVNKGPYWPVHHTSTVNNWRNVVAGVDVSPGFSPGCYIQAIGPMEIGDYTQIGPNVGLITANHDPYDSRKHQVRSIRIGGYCWIGMNAIVLPGVVLGDFTIVGAGAVVTRSFPDGYAVIGGNPARQIRDLDVSQCVRFKNPYEYHGYIPRAAFAEFRRTKLAV